MMTVAANLLSSGPTYQSSMLAISAQSLLVQLIRMAKLLMIDKAMRMLPFGGRPMALKLLALIARRVQGEKDEA